MHLAVQIALVLMSPGLLGILTWFLLERRKLGGGAKEARALRSELGRTQQEMARLRGDYEQLKEDHTAMLLHLEETTRRLEARMDRYAGIEAPPPESASVHREPPQRQL